MHKTHNIMCIKINKQLLFKLSWFIIFVNKQYLVFKKTATDLQRYSIQKPKNKKTL